MSAGSPGSRIWLRISPPRIQAPKRPSRICRHFPGQIVKLNDISDNSSNIACRGLYFFSDYGAPAVVIDHQNSAAMGRFGRMLRCVYRGPRCRLGEPPLARNEVTRPLAATTQLSQVVEQTHSHKRKRSEASLPAMGSPSAARSISSLKNAPISAGPFRPTQMPGVFFLPRHPYPLPAGSHPHDCLTRGRLRVSQQGLMPWRTLVASVSGLTGGQAPTPNRGARLDPSLPRQQSLTPRRGYRRG